MKKKISLEVSKEDFKLIKKNKKNIIINLNNEENKEIRANKNLFIIDPTIHKYLKRRVREVTTYQNITELSNCIKNKHLGYKTKELVNYNELIKDFNENDINKYGLIAVKINSKRQIFWKAILGLTIIIVFICTFLFVYNRIEDLKAKNFNNALMEIGKERIDYVFVEINPSFVLTIKDNKTNDIACLNDDCITIYNDIKVKGKNINESLDTIYNISKEKGFDVSNGIYVKSASNLNIDSKDYVKFEHINRNEENKLLDSVKNNENIKNSNNDNYYTKLWEELKKDSSYDKTYTCNMENGELKCFITEKYLTASEENNFNGLVFYDNIKRIYDKFGVKYEVSDKFGIYKPISGVYINGKLYETMSSIAIPGEHGEVNCSEIANNGEIEYLGGEDNAQTITFRQKIKYGEILTIYEKSDELDRNEEPPLKIGEYCYKLTSYDYFDVLVHGGGTIMNPTWETATIIPIRRFNLLTSQYDDNDILYNPLNSR